MVKFFSGSVWCLLICLLVTVLPGIFIIQLFNSPIVFVWELARVSLAIIYVFWVAVSLSILFTAIQTLYMIYRNEKAERRLEKRIETKF